MIVLCSCRQSEQDSHKHHIILHVTEAMDSLHTNADTCKCLHRILCSDRLAHRTSPLMLACPTLRIPPSSYDKGKIQMAQRRVNMVWGPQKMWDCSTSKSSSYSLFHLSWLLTCRISGPELSSNFSRETKFEIFSKISQNYLPKCYIFHNHLNILRKQYMDQMKYICGLDADKGHICDICSSNSMWIREVRKSLWHLLAWYELLPECVWCLCLSIHTHVYIQIYL